MEHLAGFDRKEAFNLDTEFQRVGLSLKPLPPHSPHPSLIRRMGRWQAWAWHVWQTFRTAIAWQLQIVQIINGIVECTTVGHWPNDKTFTDVYYDDF